MTDKCKPGKVPTGKNGRCVKPRSTEKRCKPGKEPIGKNGRCVKPRSTEKKCKPGKEPIGKNGRCVKPTQELIRSERSPSRPNYIDLIQKNNGSFTLESVAEHIDNPVYIYITRIDESDGMDCGLKLIKKDDDLETILFGDNMSFKYIGITYYPQTVLIYMSGGRQNAEFTYKFYNLNETQLKQMENISNKYNIEVFDE